MVLLKQKFGNNVKKLKGNRYKISFVIGGKLYALTLVHDRSPSKVLQIIDNNQEKDITTDLEPYYNCKSLEKVPRIKDLGYNSISILTDDGEMEEKADEDLLY